MSVQSWHGITWEQAKDLEASGHTVYVRSGEPRHDRSVCSQCRQITKEAL